MQRAMLLALVAIVCISFPAATISARVIRTTETDDASTADASTGSTQSRNLRLLGLGKKSPPPAVKSPPPAVKSPPPAVKPPPATKPPVPPPSPATTCSKLGFVFKGACVTATTFTPAGNKTALSFLDRCKGGWTNAIVQQTSATLGCVATATQCGTAGANICKAACTALVGVAQGLGLSVSGINGLFNTSFQKTNFLPCTTTCSALDKALLKCP